jgi:hypothetical protein
MPHLYTSAVNYFELALPLFDQASAYRFRIVLNVTVLVLGYSCMNALAQARDALRLRDSIDYDMLTGAHSRRYLLVDRHTGTFNEFDPKFRVLAEKAIELLW